MKTRKLTQIEKKKIEQIYHSSIFFKIEEVFTSTILSFIFLSFILFLIHKIISNFEINLWIILLISFIIGLAIIKKKYENRKRMLEKLFQKNNPVTVNIFDIQSYLNIYPENKRQSEYLCEINNNQILYFRTNENLGKNLSTKLKIATIKIEAENPIILSVSKSGKDNTLEIIPKEINIGFLEENIEHEFLISNKKISDLYI